MILQQCFITTYPEFTDLEQIELSFLKVLAVFDWTWKRHSFVNNNLYDVIYHFNSLKLSNYTLIFLREPYLEVDE